MIHVFGFVEYYVAPFIIAVGLIFLVYGIINYFIIGPGFEEERREMGRQNLLWATFLFFIGLVVFSVASWLFDFSSTFENDADVRIGTDTDILPVPDVPQSNP